ncbi:MAG: DUF2017 family protein [Jatrophihabitantaceae bacterium]
MKITRAGGSVRLRLAAGESAALASLIGDLVAVLRPAGLDPSDPVYQRLFPDGYQDDPEAAEAFRSLTESALHEERLQRAEQCLAELAAGTPQRRGLEVVLDPEATDRWLKVLNDIRLAIGTRLGITDDDALEIDPRARQPTARDVYAYLTGVQDSLVRAAMR